LAVKRFTWAMLALFVGRGSIARAAERKVEIVIAGSPGDAALLEDTMRAGLDRGGVATQTVRVDRLDVHEVVTPASNPKPVAVRVWFDLQTPGQAVIYMADETWERVLVRRMALPNGLDEVGREALTFILKSSVEAMLSGAQIGVSREEAKEEIIGDEARTVRDRANEKAPSAEPRGALFTFGLAYEMQGYAKAVPITHGPALLLALGDRGFHRAVWLAGTYRTPTDFETDAVRVHMTSFGGRLGMAAHPRLGPTAWLTAGALVGVDWTHVEPRIKEGLQLQSSSIITSVSSSVRPVVGIGFAVHQTLLLFQIGADVDLVRTRYVVQTDGVGSYALNPWPVRPVATFSMMLGTQPFEPDPR
jgi:hypothetical protein